MNIVLITPAGPTSRTGNRIAATRWARILRHLGHTVQMAADYDGRPADLMVAVHGWRSAGPIADFKARYPERPLVLQLSGTDIYGYLASDPAPTLRAMGELADRLVAHTSYERHRSGALPAMTAHDVWACVACYPFMTVLNALQQRSRGARFSPCFLDRPRSRATMLQRTLEPNGKPEFRRRFSPIAGVRHRPNVASWDRSRHDSG